MASEDAVKTPVAAHAGAAFAVGTPTPSVPDVAPATTVALQPAISVSAPPQWTGQVEAPSPPRSDNITIARAPDAPEAVQPALVSGNTFPFAYDSSNDIVLQAGHAAARRNLAMQMSGPVEVFPPPPEVPVPSEPTAGIAPSEISSAARVLPLEGTTRVVAHTGVGLEALASLSGSSTLNVETEMRRGAVVAKISAALVENREIIVINATALEALLDEKITSLVGANSDEGRTELERYRKIRRDLEKFRVATVSLAVGQVSKEEAVDASVSLWQGLQNWWNEDHVAICNTAFSASVFSLLLGLCKLYGADANLALIASGVIVRPSITEALKAATGLFTQKKT